MSVQKALSNGTVIINDNVTEIIADTLKYNKGRGEKKVRPLTSGGNTTSVVVSEDATTKISMVSFSLPATAQAEDMVDSWDAKYSDGTGCTIQISDQGQTHSFRRMFLVNNPDTNATSDGVIEIEFLGQAVN